MAWIAWIRNMFSNPLAGGASIQNLPAFVGQTSRFNRTLFLIAIIGMTTLLFARGLAPGEIRFVAWALIGAFASALVGAALGLLFGLPTVESKRAVIVSTQAATGPAVHPITSTTASASTLTFTPTESGSAPPSTPSTIVGHAEEELETGYRDSTSLEQIADWLTKIIVGLTLTQYGSWEHRFESLASNLTAAMMGPLRRDPVCMDLISGLSGSDLLKALDLPVCRPSPIPGGLIIVLFATTGFLICYLWMRRYFIIEMVIAKCQALETLKANSQKVREIAQRETEVALKAAEEKKQIGAARQRSLAEEKTPRDLIKDPQLERILDDAGRRMRSDAATGALAEIRERVKNDLTDPDDPWRGKFGESSSNGVRIEASVHPLVDNPQFFRVDLKVRAENAARSAELQGTKVLYFLHPTFGDQPRMSAFGLDGTAPLELFAYGAFTVGALLDDGTTLELNLATVPGAPDLFKAQ